VCQIGGIEGWSDGVSEGASSALAGEVRAFDWSKRCSQPILTADPVKADAPDYFMAAIQHPPLQSLCVFMAGVRHKSSTLFQSEIARDRGPEAPGAIHF